MDPFVDPTLPTPIHPTVQVNPVIVVPARDILAAWIWLVQEASLPPTRAGDWCYFDHKHWGNPGQSLPLEPCEPFVSVLGKLYCASQFYDLRELYDLVNSRNAANITLSNLQLDRTIASVINSSVRFRHSLSEHIAYWVHLTNLAKSGQNGRFFRSKPNLQPEDKGPDGVTCVVADSHDVPPVIHVHSVKSSEQNPRSLLASRSFRRNGNATGSGKLLEEFWCMAHENESTIRLDSMLEQISLVLEWQASRQLRSALLGTCAFHGTVVADESHAREADFEGYQHVVTDIARRHAMYLGSSSWRQVAEACRLWVQNCLSQSGVTY
jgi:hypothetical protein